MKRSDALHILGSLYQDSNGMFLSTEDRIKTKRLDLTYTYGEIDFTSFATLLSIVDVKPNEVFYDLGSGTGKPVFTSALLEPFAKCVGIEIIKGLCDESIRLQKAFDTALRSMLHEEVAQISFINKNMFEVDISDGDVFYMASTCFDEEMLTKIARLLEKTKKGTRVIMLNYKLQSDAFAIIHHTLKKMSWGDNVETLILKKKY